MFLFDTAADDDELAVLMAYAAEEVAEAARRAQKQTQAPESLSMASHDQCEDPEADAAEEDSAKDFTAGKRQIWLTRLREVEGVSADRMAPIHGRLIAHGLLQFQLLGREEGVVYRLTTAGRNLTTDSAAEAA